MRSRPFILVWVGLFLASPASAWDLAVVGGFNFSHPSVNPDPPVGTELSTRAAMDFGALAEVPIADAYRFESGLVRHTRATLLEGAGSAVEARYSGWLVPLTFRFMRADFLGLGFGPYVAFLDAKTRYESSANGGPAVESEADDPTRKGFELGLRVNLRIAIPVGPAKAIFDGSYLFGFTDLNKSGVGETKSQDLLLLFGVQLPFGAETKTASADEPAKAAEPSAPNAATEPTPAPTSKPEPKKKKKQGKRR